MNEQIVVIPYTATSISIIARIIFMYLLYTKKKYQYLFFNILYFKYILIWYVDIL